MIWEEEKSTLASDLGFSISRENNGQNSHVLHPLVGIWPTEDNPLRSFIPIPSPHCFLPFSTSNEHLAQSLHTCGI